MDASEGCRNHAQGITSFRVTASLLWLSQDAHLDDLLCLPADVLNDTFRVKYYQEYLSEAIKAVEEDAVKLKGYFAWSLLDNFEWADGYAKRFGIVHVDYSTMQRSPKHSAKWLANFFQQTLSD